MDDEKLIGDLEDEIAAAAGEEIPLPKELTEETEEASEEKHKSIYQQILTLGVSGKVQLALKGNKEARAILIKEPNKLICSAVVKSPKITESEVASFAKSRSVSDEVLRLIARNKDWVRNHDIVLSLVNNPRTPIAISLQFMQKLNDKEIADLAKSKAVSGALSGAAKRQAAQKAQKAQKGQKH